jgi:hypothetical protein
MNYRIVIPTHRRAATLGARTLKWLRACGVPDARVTLLVSDEADAEAYRAAYPDCCVPTVPAFDCLRDKLNYLHRTARPGERVLVIEDDLTGLLRKRDNRAPLTHDLDALVADGFAACERYGTALWGVTPTNNGLFMKERASAELRFCVGYCYGFVGTGDPRLEVTLNFKHDYERTLLYFIRYGAVARLNYVGVETRSFSAPGGLQEYSAEARRAAELASNEYLLRRYPHLVARAARLNRTLNAYTELRLNARASRDTDWMALQRLHDAANGFPGCW